MPELASSLNDPDLGFLRIIAEHWGIDLRAPDVRSGLNELVAALRDPGRAAAMLAELPAEARAALTALQREKGGLPWAEFVRRFGVVREMGAGRRDRERPDLAPVSSAEVLWYRALAARGFFITPSGMQEFAYIPDDLRSLLPPAPSPDPEFPACPAEAADIAHPVPATDAVLDEICTFLAAQRMGLGGFSDPILLGLATSLGLLDAQGMPLPEKTRAFLEAGRGEALKQLFEAWRASPTINELRLLPGLKCEGGWGNNPLQARQTILAEWVRLPAGRWWDLASFAGSFRERRPDFQRPAGDYDSWFIRSQATGEFLRGFEHWDEIDGALIRFVIAGPLHRLGAVDLAAREAGGIPAAFRLSRWAKALIGGQPPAGLPAENAPLRANFDGRLRVPRRVPRAARYQLARFCIWEAEEAGEYRYRVTPASLERARAQGLRLSHLVSLLRRYASPPPSPGLVQALERWDENGTQARLETVVVLKVSSPEILAALKRSRVARFLGEPLGSTAVTLPAGARDKVLAALAELGYLAEAGFSDQGGL